jgi:hypothetical protein
MSIEKLLEDTLINDFKLDAVLAQQTIRNHDYPLTLAGDETLLQQEVLAVIVVTANDRGEFKIGSGIHGLGVEVKIQVNAEADGFTGTLLDDLCDRIRLRMQPSPTVSAPGREAHFSTPSLKIFGITQQENTDRTESGFERMRTVRATIIAAQLA